MFWKMNKYKKRIKRNRYTKDIYNLNKSFSYAFHGLKFAIDNERNMRIHIVVSLLVLEFACLYEISKVELLVLLVILSLVIAMEMVNTALEALVNMGTDSYNSFAKIAKDVAAGAVLVVAICAAAFGVILFGDIQRLQHVFDTVVKTPVYVLVFFVEVILAYIFIFRWDNRKNTNKRKRIR